ncbi:alpha/beta fold hydrolase [Kribbella albertanoniae]|uniref:Alpha/beta hydrolase n=1 Tax=Kribbella albertanoniae TaxID=1266829 RepID=A0A4R4PZS7_9ACTN|nr:alpha/beta hydrolase [Kribbella albertanoniae]TDC28104.1 alpha/beta hydrolase [Kribbella albertanoniae]
MKYFITRQEDQRLDPAARPQLRGDFVELSDGFTQYELTGPDDGEVVVFTGGITIPLAYWDELVSDLHAQGLRTLTYSGYGRGCSDRLQTPYDESLFVRQLVELTVRLDLPRPHHVVGTSMGALVAMAYALRQTDSVSTLTVVGPAGLLRQPPWQKALLHAGPLTGVIAKRLGHRLLEGHLSHNVRDPQRAAELTEMVREAYRYEGSMFAFFSTLQNFPLSGRTELYSRTSQLGIPTLLVWGDDDQVTPIENLGLAQQLLQPDRTHIIEECGHMAPLERPTAVADHIVSFLTSSTPRGSTNE